MRARHSAAPQGPYIAQRVLHCHQLLANVVVDERGKLRVNGHGPAAIVVLENEGGRRFVAQAWDDVGQLLSHADAQALKILELQARILRLEQREG